MTAIAAQLKVLVGSVICSPAVGKMIYHYYSGRVTSDGSVFTFRVNATGFIPFRQVASLYWGFYEKSERKLVRQYLRNDLDVVELGSSIGVIACSISKKQNQSRQLICVEANPLLIDSLRWNLNANAPQRDGTIFCAAIDYSGVPEVSMKLDVEGLGSAATREDGGEVRVRAMTLREIVQAYCDGQFALVSDIEGAEVGMLLRDKDTFRRCEQIIAELHSTVFDGIIWEVDDIRSLIRESGFIEAAHRRNVFVYNRI